MDQAVRHKLGTRAVMPNHRSRSEPPRSDASAQSETYLRLRLLLLRAADFAPRFFAASAVSPIRFPASSVRNHCAAILKSSVQNSLGLIATGCKVAISPLFRPGNSQRPSVYM